MSTISVIIPVYNVGKYVRKCLESIIGQTYSDFEAIVVDDGSTDESSIICDEFAKKDSRIKLFHELNGGVSRALNVGLENASGEWLYFVDGDDWIEKNALEVMMLRVKHHPSIDILCFNNYINSFMEEKNVAGEERFWHGSQIDWLLAATIFPKYIEKKYHIVLPVMRCRWSKMIKRSLVKDAGILFRPELTLGQDAAFCAEVFAESKNVLTTNDYLYHYRSFGDSNSNKYRENWSYLKYRILYLSDNEKISKVKDFQEVKSLLIFSLAKTMLTRYLCHPKCKKTFKEKKGELDLFLESDCMKFDFSFLSMMLVLPGYLPLLLLLKFRMTGLFLYVGKVIARVKLSSSHS